MVAIECKANSCTSPLPNKIVVIYPANLATIATIGASFRAIVAIVACHSGSGGWVYQITELRFSCCCSLTYRRGQQPSVADKVKACIFDLLRLHISERSAIMQFANSEFSKIIVQNVAR